MERERERRHDIASPAVRFVERQREDNCVLAEMPLKRVLTNILHTQSSKRAKSAEGVHSHLRTHVHQSTRNIKL